MLIFYCIFIAIRKKYKCLTKQDLWFLCICFISALLGAWRGSRENISFKSASICGITWYLFFDSFYLILNNFVRKNFKFPVPFIISIGVFTLIITISFYWITFESLINNHSSRPLALDIANVCHYRSQESCRCIQITSFSPQTFLEQDIRQCRDRFSSFASAIFWNNTIRQNLIFDFEREDVAFLVYPKSMLEIDSSRRIFPIMQKLYGGGLNCIPYVGDVKVCYKKVQAVAEA